MRQLERSLLIALMIATCVACGAPSATRESPTLPVPTETPVPSSTPRPTSAPAPTVLPEVGAGLPVQGDPQDLVLRVDDLPPGFEPAGDESEGANIYSAIYLRAAAVTSEEASSASLLGVIINVGVYADTTNSQQQFQELSALSPETIIADLKQASPNVEAIDVEQIQVRAQGVDAATGYRVHYRVDPTRLFEYRYRVLVGNAVANLIVSARAGEEIDEPTTFRQQTLDILQKQIDRLNQARR